MYDLVECAGAKEYTDTANVDQKHFDNGWIPFDVPPLVNRPPPWGGDRHLAQKAQETLGAEENFCLGYTGTGIGGGRHLVTAPPPPWGGPA